MHRAIPQAFSLTASCAVCALNLSLTSYFIYFHTLPVFVVRDGFYTTILWGSSWQQGDLWVPTALVLHSMSSMASGSEPKIRGSATSIPKLL